MHGGVYLENGKRLKRALPAMGSRATKGAACKERQLSAFFLASFLASCALLFVSMQEECDLPQFTPLQHTINRFFTMRGGECNYNNGAWVRTSSRPLYSGHECQRWLSPMWACRLHPNRSSFLYEFLHWQPYTCYLPPLHPPTFLHRMENRIIAFIGDSLGRQQFQSLMCLLTQGKDEYGNVLDVGTEFGFQTYIKSNKVTKTPAVRPSSWAYRFKETNTTIIFSWSPTLCNIENLATKETRFFDSNFSELDHHHSHVPEVALHVDRPPAFLTSNLAKLHVVVLNTGPHWSLEKFFKNKWKPHLAGKALNMNSTLESVKKLYKYAMFNLMEWLDVQEKMGASRATIYYRTLSPQHFFHGDWNSGGRCDNTHYRFINSVSMQRQSRALHEDFISDFIDQRKTKIKLLNITWLSQLRDEAHISKYTLKSKSGVQDCLHWCLPGVPDTWNAILYAQLLHTLPN